MARPEDPEFPDDARKLVNPADIQPGGKYYSVVKLQIRYEKQQSNDERYAQGTGWLIKPDLLVTAGHCVFDHTYGFGKATEVKVYVGYNGKASVGTKNVQFREGKQVATSGEWIQSDVNHESDVAFVQLNTRFDNIMPIQFSPTPTRDSMTLEVVGYPLDKSLSDESGAQMYSMSRNISFDLNISRLHMLEHNITTYAGKNIGIGTHAYGSVSPSSASVIHGKYGNYYNAFIETFSKPLSPTQAGSITYVTVPVIDQQDNSIESLSTESDDFWSSLKNVTNTTANIGSQILRSGSPFLGPLGGPISALAGTALGFANKMTESSFDTTSAQSGSAYKEQCYRALVGEAALQTVLNMDPSQVREYGVFEEMQTVFSKNSTNVPAVAKLIGPSLLEPALHIALLNGDPAAAERAELTFPLVAIPPSSRSPVDGQREAFAQSVTEAARRIQAEEGFLDFLDPVITTAVRTAPALLNTIGELVGVDQISGLEGSDDALQPHFESVVQRAVLGEGALQGLMAIPPEKLEAEGFLDSIVKEIGKIGATVVQAAPAVIRNVTPIVMAIAKRDRP